MEVKSGGSRQNIHLLVLKSREIGVEIICFYYRGTVDLEETVLKMWYLHVFHVEVGVNRFVLLVAVLGCQH